MEAILLVLGVLFLCNQTPTQAAPSIEACPNDSVMSEDVCKCDVATCTKPPCLSELLVATNGSDLPGKCCPTYECVGCKDEDKIDGKCLCAKGAVIDGYKCACVEKEKHLVDGECVCNPALCPFPELCDKKSVAVTVTEGCCKKTICKPCPSDSESTNVEGDEIEDHCVCLPCKAECGYNKTVVIKKHGSGFPGNCCDLYECKKPEEIKGCFYNQLFYENGKQWFTQDLQICKCNNGLSLCSNQKEKEALSCFVDNELYKDSQTWYKDEGCTTCKCKNGIHSCISHYCDVKENLVQMNHSCTIEGDVYLHSETWIEKDGCTKCTCVNGNINCNDNLCDTSTTTVKVNECQPLANCNKTCLNGFRIGRKGCEICKCSVVRLGQDILTKYNISMNDLIKILDEYKTKRLSTTPATISTSSSSVTTSTSASTTTTTTDKTVEIVNNHLPVVIMNRNAEFFEETGTTTTTEPSVRPTDKENDSLIYILIIVLVCLMFAVLVPAIFCFYKSRRKSSIDLSHCHYQTVNTHNNNNTIKKTDQLL